MTLSVHPIASLYVSVSPSISECACVSSVCALCVCVLRNRSLYLAVHVPADLIACVHIFLMISTIICSCATDQSHHFDFSVPGRLHLCPFVENAQFYSASCFFAVKVMFLLTDDCVQLSEHCTYTESSQMTVEKTL